MMRTILSSFGLVVMMALACAQPFTYQGLLKQNGTPVNGTLSMTFKLYNALTGGSQVGSAITQNVSVQNGLFTVELDFGSVWDGSPRYLEIQVGSTTLSPRVKINPTPYAIRANTAGTANPIGAAGGDLSGSYPNPLVAGLQGRSVANTAPSAGQVLKWDGSAWAPAADQTGGTPSGAAGGDLSGSYPNPLVAGLQGRSVANTAPSTGQVLKWDGTAWAPAADQTGGTPSGAAGGDLSGSYPNPLVAGLRGRAIANTAPSTGQVLKWDGTAWAPAADQTGGTPSGAAGGDLSGS
jgi:hypothetical protein